MLLNFFAYIHISRNCLTGGEKSVVVCRPVFRSVDGTPYPTVKTYKVCTLLRVSISYC